MVIIQVLQMGSQGTEMFSNFPGVTNWKITKVGFKSEVLDLNPILHCQVPLCVYMSIYDMYVCVTINTHAHTFPVRL